jgi:hypothetical protein
MVALVNKIEIKALLVCSSSSGIPDSMFTAAGGYIPEMKKVWMSRFTSRFQRAWTFRPLLA